MSTPAIEAPKVMPYLTWIANRTPHQKAHINQGQAHKAVLFRLQDGKLSEQVRVYKWTNHGWELLWDIPEGTARRDLPWI